MLLLLLYVALALSRLAVALPASTADWYTVEWNAPEFIAFEGNFIVPPVPAGAKHGVAFVWSGLQNAHGVIQSVLDARTGSWSLGSVVFGKSTKSHGTRFDVLPGDYVHFSYAKRSGAWTCTLSGPRSTSTTFDVDTFPMTRAILAVELRDVIHDFAVIYQDISITAANAPARQWCKEVGTLGFDKGQYAVMNATADGTTCKMGAVVLRGTK